MRELGVGVWALSVSIGALVVSVGVVNLRYTEIETRTLPKLTLFAANDSPTN